MLYVYRLCFTKATASFGGTAQKQLSTFCITHLAIVFTKRLGPAFKLLNARKRPSLRFKLNIVLSERTLYELIAFLANKNKPSRQPSKTYSPRGYSLVKIMKGVLVGNFRKHP